jgi:hypothetical protein
VAKGLRSGAFFSRHNCDGGWPRSHQPVEERKGGGWDISMSSRVSCSGERKIPWGAPGAAGRTIIPPLVGGEPRLCTATAPSS